MARHALENAQNAYFRQKARDCVKSVSLSNDPATRLAWLELADRWLRMIPPAERTGEERFEQDIRDKGTGQTDSTSEH